MGPFLSFLLLKVRNRHFLAMDILIFAVTPAAALALRVESFDGFERYYPSLAIATVICIVAKLAVLYWGGLYTRFWRYAGIDELARLAVLGALGVLFETLIYSIALRYLGWMASDFPRSLPIIEGMLAIIAAGGIRFSLPLSERLYQRRFGKQHGERVVVAGARSAGVMIVQEMQSNPRLGMTPVAFVDNDAEKQGMHIRNVPVLGRCSEIALVCRETSANKVIIAMPTARGKVIREIVQLCNEMGIHTKIMPNMYELLDGSVSVKKLRDIEIEDLLRREPVNTDTSAVSSLLEGKRVMVTGGGGSIGSELCRQVLGFNPKSLVILGHGENSVFEIQNELARLREHNAFGADEASRHLDTEIHSVIADIRFPERINSVFNEHRPEVVFHSAAHKHVPLMEGNPAEAITNNVIGTRNLLNASLAVGTDHFVMISSDKAVNPTSIMGTTKRVAELLVHRAARQSGKAYVAVRFGNVLGSRGSVVHTFRHQIAAGGPVTVTHPDMMRYFMTIPEAVQLVLQASALGKGGEVFMLDMGDPIKIVDMAMDMIRLSGLEVGRDIDIVYSGLRPGEKLFEEMFLHTEYHERTQHERIFIAPNAGSYVTSWLDRAIEELEWAARRDNRQGMFDGLRSLVPEFQPAGAPGTSLSQHPAAHAQAGAAAHPEQDEAERAVGPSRRQIAGA